MNTVIDGDLVHFLSLHWLCVPKEGNLTQPALTVRHSAVVEGAGGVVVPVEPFFGIIVFPLLDQLR